MVPVYTLPSLVWMLNRILSEVTGQSYEQICKDTDRDHYMTAEEAMQYGLVDRVITKR